MIARKLRNSAEFAALLLAVFLFSTPCGARDWGGNINKLIEILGESRTGEKLLERAMEKARSQRLTGGSWLEAGELSATDTILTRRFDKGAQKIIYQQISRVSINSSLPQDSAVLDLAHELTHFIFRKEFNPYSEKFHLADFLRGTIESEGGEAHAFVMECKVGMELHQLDLIDRREIERCSEYFKKGAKVAWNRVLSDFYSLGRWYGRTLSELDEDVDVSSFPRLNSKESKFISAAAGVPYPLAAIREFKMVQQSACENDMRRLKQLQTTLKRTSSGRLHGNPDTLRDEIVNLQGSLKKRCSELRFSLSSDL